MRKVLAVGLLLAASAAQADYFESGFHVSGYFESGYFIEDGGSQVAVPNVIGEANAAAADAILENDGLDLGVTTERCSDAADDEVVGQDPAPGVLVDLASLVDVLVSNGVECPSGSPGSKGVTLPGLSIGL